ncbi:MAG: hypothetical protein COA67_11215 [Lutibacter sp.]|nr:MAG: hypothetical protein COA67_11215 [Lutibacter sp.]
MNKQIKQPIMNKQIFIGGTGRSGTTIMSKFLSSHRDITKLPTETRFLIDSYGMIDLYTSLTNNYSIDKSDISIRNIKKLLEEYLTSPRTSPYIYQDFYKFFGEDFYKKQVDEFLSNIILGEFIGYDFQTKFRNYKTKLFFGKYINKTFSLFEKISNKKIKRFNPLTYGNSPETKYIGKYFENETELEKLIADFTNNLFMQYAKSKNKGNWCEDTPANIAHIPFLAKIFPDAYFIHMVRNPLGVAYSMGNMPWAPTNYSDSVDYLSNVYDRIIRVKESKDFNKIKFLEVRLEDFSNDFNHTIPKLNDFLEIPNDYDGSVEIKSSKVDYYKDLMDKSDFDFLNEKLSKYIEYFGYK